MATPMNNTGNAVGSTDPRDLIDNAQVLDKLMLSLELSITDRLGTGRATWASFEARINAVITSLDVSGFTFPTVAAGLAATTNGQYFRVPQNDGFVYYQNVAGAATKVATLMGAQEMLKAISDTVSQVSLTKKEATRAGLSQYDGNGLHPVVTDADNNVLLAWNAGSDTFVGVGQDGQKIMTESGVSLYGGDGLYPVVTDAENRVLLGYNGGSDTLVGVGVGSDRGLTKSGVSLYEGGDIIPIVTDGDNKVILGYDANSDRLVGLFGDGIVAGGGGYKDVPFPYAMLPAAVNYFLTYGQSLSVGHWGTPVLSTTQPYSNLTFSGGVRGGTSAGENYTSFVPLVESTASFESNDGETPCSGAANFASLLAHKENGVRPDQHVILSSAPGHGGYRINQLNKGTEWYSTHLMKHLSSAFGLNSNLKVQALMWLQGESDSGTTSEIITRAAYLSAFLQLVSDVNADALALTGQATPVIFLSYQHSSYVTRSGGATQLAVADAEKQSNRVYVITPTYHLPHHTDNLHLSAVGYKWIGAYFGRAYKQMMHDGIKPRAIRPVSATHVGTLVKVKFTVPVAPLVFDTTLLGQTKDYGFVVTVNGAAVTLTRMYIENGETVVIEATAALSGTVKVRYALDNNGTAIVFGASGNLRDSCRDTVVIGGTERHLHYIAPHFELTSVTGVI